MTLGLDSNRVVLLREHDAWRAAFTEEEQRIVAALAPHAVTVEHAGSTSIRGVPAKPILDIVIGVPNFEQAAIHVAPMEALGYTYRGEFGIPRRHYFVRGEPRTHHVHMLELGGPGWRSILTFRDVLGSNTDLARQYSDAKQQLASAYANDRDRYQQEKDAVVERLLTVLPANQAPVDKVLAYITHGSGLAVFTEPDFPEVGIQVPGGSLEPDETAQEAVLREAAEETGLDGLRLERFLGSRDIQFPGSRRKRRHFFHLRCEGTVPDVWQQWEQTPHTGEPPILFELRWVELAAVPELFAEQGVLLDKLNR
jgi:GrpB-like predicted nucleotidyltransferase (UPF0157 family)/8-oxo-dGTP pyrophosphatase MutT (NUDIX family)